MVGQAMTAISFDNALGIHPQALSVRSQRSEILANNIANADTPNFKSRDLDFKGLLISQTLNHQMALMV